MILRFVWIGLLVSTSAAVLISALIGGAWLWGVFSAPPLDEPRAIRDRLLKGQASVADLFPEPWQTICVMPPYHDPQDVILNHTDLAQNDCVGWNPEWQSLDGYATLLLVSPTACRAIPVRRDIFDAANLGPDCFTAASGPVMNLDPRGTPPRYYLEMR